MPDIAPLAPHRVVPLTEIRPAESNPRKIPPKAIELLAKSLSRFGWQQPLVVDKTGELIVGHTRLLAAQHLKLTEAPVVYAENLTDDEVRAYRIADNRTHDKIGVRSTYANGRGGPRVFHTMAAGAIRNPLRVLDHELMGAAKTKVEGLLREWHLLQLEAARTKVAARVERG